MYNDIISKLPGKVFGSQIIHTVLNIIQDFLWNKWTLRQAEIKNYILTKWNNMMSLPVDLA